MACLKIAAEQYMPCTSNMISDILRSLVESNMAAPGRNNSWMFEQNTMRCLSVLLECAKINVLYNTYHVNEEPYPNFYILQNCIVVLNIILDAAEKNNNTAQNSEIMNNMFAGGIASEFRMAL